MPLKKHVQFLSNESCCFCKLKETDVLFGPIYKSRSKYENKYIVVHYYCLLMASKIEQNGRDNQGILGFFPKDIIKELKRGNSQQCCFCTRLGATVHCINKNCDKIFHLPCGISKGSIHQFYNLFDSFCHLHKPKQVIPANILKHIKDSCVICSLDIDKRNKYDCLWPSCCKATVLIHRKCIQTMACNAGYYFKCPLCNNTDIFKKEMQRIGIYIPEQDASWELEPNAYEELRVRGSGCESKICVCIKGRNYTLNNTAWQLELCKVCGGNGTHLGCTSKWDKKNGFKFNWFCEICKPVYLENKSSQSPEHNSAPVENEPSVNVGGTDDFTQASSAPLDKPTDVPQLRSSSYQPVARVPVTSTLPKPVIEPQVPQELEEDDNLIIVSEGEEEAMPPNNLPLIDVSNQDTPSETPHQSSDDELQFVKVIDNKEKTELISTRKRFRTAPWAPPEIKRIESMSESSGGGNNSASRTLTKIHSSLNASSTLSACLQKQPLDKSLWKECQPGPSTEIRLDMPGSSKKSDIDFISLKDQVHQSKDHKEFIRQSISKSFLSSKQHQICLPQQNKGSFPSDIGLKLSEISINRIVSKASSDRSNLVIDLSSDEESAQQSPNDNSEKRLVSELPKMRDSLGCDVAAQRDTNVSKLLNLKQLLSSPAIDISQSLSNKGAEKYFETWIDSQIQIKRVKQSEPKAKTKKLKTDSDLLKKMNSSVTIQVVLSSDDEDEKPRNTSTVQTSGPSRNINSNSISTNRNNLSDYLNLNISGIQSTSSNQNSERQVVQHSYLEKLEKGKGISNQAVEISLKRKKITESTAQDYNMSPKRNTCPKLSLPSTSCKPNTEKDMFVSNSSLRSESILQSVLNKMSNCQKTSSSKSEILIVSDDEDEISVESVRCVGKTLTESLNGSSSNRDSESLNFSSFNQSFNEGIGIISQVVTLSDPILFDSQEDELPFYDKQEKKLTLGSSKLNVENPAKCLSSESALEQSNLGKINPKKASTSKNAGILCNDQSVVLPLTKSEQFVNSEKTIGSQEYVGNSSLIISSIQSIDTLRCSNVSCNKELHSEIEYCVQSSSSFKCSNGKNISKAKSDASDQVVSSTVPSGTVSKGDATVAALSLCAKCSCPVKTSNNLETAIFVNGSCEESVSSSTDTSFSVVTTHDHNMDEVTHENNDRPAPNHDLVKNSVY